MTWRRSLIYFLVLALVGGYFYAVEVVQKERKETAEREAKRFFHLGQDDVQGLEIYPRGETPVTLEKKEQWLIAAPVAAEVEKSALDSFLGALVGLSSEVTVGEAVQDLKPYGLEDPALKIRFLASSQWTELAIGDKNPVSRGYYALAGKDRVHLINESNWSLLNKGINELRRRALFTFAAEEALRVDIAWEGGARFALQRSDGPGAGWQAVDRPDLKIKTSKVQNLLEQIQFLRAQSFENEQAVEAELSRSGLQPARVTVKMELGGDRKAELKLGQSPPDGGDKSLYALSSELAAIVQVDSQILNDIPKEMEGLEDRSLLASKSKDVKQVQWRFGESSGSLANIEANQWRLKIGDGEVREPKESWRVNSLLWELQQAEFSRKLAPAPARPENPHARIEVDAGDRKTTLIWEKSALTDPQPAPVRVWIEDAGRVECVEVGSEPLKKVEEEIATLLAGSKQDG